MGRGRSCMDSRFWVRWEALEVLSRGRMQSNIPFSRNPDRATAIGCRRNRPIQKAITVSQVKDGGARIKVAQEEAGQQNSLLN